MQELEIVRERIQNHYRVVKTDEDLEWNRAIDLCTNIINAHISRENDPETTRSSRDTQGAEHEINLPKEEFEMLRFSDSVTFRCGNEYVSLYMGEDEATREYKIVDDGWIPVEERLPERTLDEKMNESYKKYLVFIDGVDGWDIDMAVYDFWNDKKWREAYDGYDEIENVIAWRPLPEPYRPDQERSEGE